MTKLRLIIAGLLATVALSVGGLALAAYTQPLGGSIFPLTFVTQPVTNLSDAYNEMLALINAQVVGISPTYPNTALEPSNGFDSSQTVFSSTTPQQNPVLLYHNQNVPVASGSGVNGPVAAETIVAGQTNRTIYPGGAGISVEAVGGNMATCTSVKMLCNPSGLNIANWNIAQLVSGVPVGLYSAATVGNGAEGCNSGDAVLVSAIGGGGCATATGLVVGFPYTVQ